MGAAEFSGHIVTESTLKSDQEEAIVALKRAVAARRTARTVLVESNVRVSKTNSKIERAVGRWRSQFRKLKIHLEDKIACRVPRTSPDDLLVG